MQSVQTLTVDMTSVHPNREIEQQQRSLFQSLKDRLGEASPANIRTILVDREVVNCEPELTTEMIDQLCEKLQTANQ